LSDGPLNANNGLFLATNIDQKTLFPGYDPITGDEIQFSDDEYVSNPWFVVNQLENNVGRKRFTTATTLKYNFEKWLYAQVRLGLDQQFDIKPYRDEGWLGYMVDHGFDGLMEKLAFAAVCPQH
jgi:hypothetical protein